MKTRIAAIALGALFTTLLHAADSPAPLTVEITEPKVRITIPGMSGIPMDVHPMNEQKPVFRLLGEMSGTRIAVIATPSDTPVAPMDCASAVANLVLAQTAVPRDQLFLGRSDEQTFLIIYGLPLEQSVSLNTHIVSSDGANHCIEAHVTRNSTSEEDVGPWFNGFGDSRIETF